MKREALRFFGVQAEDHRFGAIRDATFTLYRDEAILLTGLFNSGLATLPRLLNGELREFAGEIRVNGTQLTRISQNTAGIAVVGRQHLLMEDMTLADGIRMRCGGGRLGVMPPLRCGEELAQLLELTHMDVQMTAAKSPFGRIKQDILAAYASGARIMVLTDMELYCNNEEYLELEKILFFLKTHGVALMIVVVNDSLWRYTSIADRCLVMRAGILTTVLEKGPDGLFDEDEIHHVTVGRRFLPRAAQSRREQQETGAVLPARFVLCTGTAGLRVPLTPGRVVGLYDSDSRLPATIEAFLEALNGLVSLLRDGVRFPVKTPRDLAGGGMAVILNASAEKLIFQNLSPAENVAFFVQRRVSSVFYRARLAQYIFDDVTRRYSFFRCGDALRGRQDCYGLSYQQIFELMVAKWLAANPDAVILFTALSNEDIKMTERFRDLQRELTGRGKAVLLVSADYDRLEQDCEEIYEI